MMVATSYKDARPNLELLAQVIQNGTKFFQVLTISAQKITGCITCFSMDID